MNEVPSRPARGASSECADVAYWLTEEAYVELRGLIKHNINVELATARGDRASQYAPCPS